VRRFALIVAGLICLLAMTPEPGVAQTATPTGTRDVPLPAECTIAPLTIEQLREVFARPPASPVAQVASPVAQPTGTPADAATTEAVRATIRQLIACGNAGDFWRLLATYSDRYLQIYLHAYVDPKTGITDVLYEAYREPNPNPPAPEDLTAILAIGEALVQPDGRVAIAITADNSPAPVTIFYLVQSGDRWLIDDFLLIRGENPDGS
jgi:hypothetical protein